jgi:deoxyribose-phosphate aldolase
MMGFPDGLLRPLGRVFASMTSAEIEALVEQVGDEILGRLGLTATALEAVRPALQAAPSAWPRPQGGYASSVELVCASPDATAADVRSLCLRASKGGLPVAWTSASVIATAVSALTGSPTRAGALIDFPSGNSSTPARLADIENALRLGADMINLTLGAGRARVEAEVLQAEIRAAATLCADAGAPLAVTLEAPILSEKDLASAAAAVLAAGADALCSSAGAGSHAFASDRSIALLREVAGSTPVVAGGRIAGFAHAAALIAAGADRIALADPFAILDAASAQ